MNPRVVPVAAPHPDTLPASGEREHLRRLYAKTGTGRQAELVKLVAGFSSPLVG